MKNNFKSISQLLSELNQVNTKIDNDSLSIKDVEQLAELSKQLYERSVILKYKAYETKSESGNENIEEQDNQSSAPKSVSFKMKRVSEAEQTNLLDAISQEEKTYQPTVNVTSSVHKKIEQELEEKPMSVAERLQKAPVTDLKTVIPLHQKFLFMNDLFKGEKNDYDSALEKINSFQSLTEALNYVDNELKNQFSWDMEAQSTIDFVELVKRRYAI